MEAQLVQSTPRPGATGDIKMAVLKSGQHRTSWVSYPTKRYHSLPAGELNSIAYLLTWHFLS